LLTCACGKNLRVGDDKAGKKGKCPGCGRVLDIPGTAGGISAPSAKPRLPVPTSAVKAAPKQPSVRPANPLPQTRLPSASSAQPSHSPVLFPGPFESATPVSDVGLSIPQPAAPSSDALPFEFADIPVGDVTAPMDLAAAPAPPPVVTSPLNIPTRKRIRHDGPQPGFHIQLSPMWVVLIVLLILVPALLLTLKLGPLRARDQWNAVTAQGLMDINDVVSLAIRAQLANSGAWDPNTSPWRPGAKDVEFLDAGIFFRMPDRAGFIGSSTEGHFQGFYYTHTGEIEADTPIAGTMVHVTGHVRDGKVTAFINGVQAVMPPPKPDQ
jgi:hypothetical protein